MMGATKVSVSTAVMVAFLALIATGFSFYVYERIGFTKTTSSFGAILGILIYILIAVMGLASILSIPVTLFFGIGCMFAAVRHGRVAFFGGFLSFVLGATNLLIWTKYGGLPIKIPGCTWCNFHGP